MFLNQSQFSVLSSKQCPRKCIAYSVKRSIEGVSIRKCTQRHIISQCKAVKSNSGSCSAADCPLHWPDQKLTESPPYEYVVHSDRILVCLLPIYYRLYINRRYKSLSVMLWVAENNTDPLFYLTVASLGPTFMTFVFSYRWISETHTVYRHTKNQIIWYQLNASNKWAL